MSEFKVEKPGYYRTSRGEIAKVYEILPPYWSDYRVRGRIDYITADWTVEGLFIKNDGDDPHNLVKYLGENYPRKYEFEAYLCEYPSQNTFSSDFYPSAILKCHTSPFQVNKPTEHLFPSKWKVIMQEIIE